MPRVVIVGGQFAGRRVAALLPKDWTVVVVDERGFIEYSPSILRCLVQPSHTDRVLVQPKDPATLTATAVHIKMASDGRGGHVVCSNQGEVPFDYLVLATGSSSATPIKPRMAGTEHKVSSSAAQNLQARASEIRAAASTLAAADTVLVVGGGPVGVELAAEVASAFGVTKRITLIASQPRLLDGMPSKASAYAERWLALKGVQVLCSTRVNAWPQAGTDGQQEVVTASGQILVADVVYNCTGCKAQGQPLCQSLADASSSSTALDGSHDATEAPWRGIPVNPSMQVLGLSNVFACGDAVHAPTAFTKTAYTADLSASIAASNIIRAHNAQPLLKFPQDLPHLRLINKPPDVLAVSLGRYDGILQLNNLILTGSLAAANKWFIEHVQLQIAGGSWVWLQVWLLIETAMTWLCSFLFVR